MAIFAAVAHGAVEPWSVLVFELGIAFLCLLWALKAVKEKAFTLEIPALIGPLLGLFVLGLTQSLAWRNAAAQRQSISLDVDATRSVTLILGCLLLWAIVVNLSLWHREWWRRLVWALPAFGVTLAILGLAQRFTSPGMIYWYRKISVDGFGPFVNRNHFAGYLEMLLAFPLALILTRCIQGEMRWLYGSASAVMGVAVLFTLSRGGAITLTAELIFIVALGLWWSNYEQKNQRTRWLAPVAGGLIIVLIFAGVLWIGAEPVIMRLATGDATGKTSVTDISSGRGEIWSNTWQMIKANPVTGVGLGAFETIYPNYRQDSLMNGIVGEAHNDYLQLVSDAGCVGVALGLWFLIVLVQVAKQIKLQRDPLLAGLALGATAGIFGLLVHSLFDFNLHLPSHAALFLLLTVIVSKLCSPEMIKPVYQY